MADWMTLLDASVLFSLAQHATTTLAAWRLRRTIPAEGRFVAPWGPVVPVLALGAMIALCVLAFRPDAAGGGARPEHFLWLFYLVLAGALVAVITRWAARRQRPESA
jgi:amino acid transporter